MKTINMLQKFFVILGLLYSFPANAYDIEIDGIFYNINKVSNTAEVTYKNLFYYSYSGDITIPETIRANGVTYTVNAIGEKAFGICPQLTSVSLPSSIKSIGERAFEDCSGLIKILIPSSVQTIGNNAFMDCFFLTENFVNNSMLTSNNNWYAHLCDSETEDGLLTEKGTFCRCRPTASGKITLPEGITSIPQTAFRNCVYITEIELSSTINFIGSWAFQNCSRLWHIDLSTRTSIIQAYAFSGCTALQEICIGTNTPPTLYQDPFEESIYSICHLQVPTSSVKTYQNAEGWKKFSHIETAPTLEATGKCGDNLEYKVYSNGFVEISGTGDMYEYDITKPWSPSRVTSIKIQEGATSISKQAFEGSRILSISIPNSIRSIGESAFKGCINLANAEIGNSVTSIGKDAFKSCSNLTNITFPKATTSIGEGAFAGCSRLASITIPHSVISIGSDAFSDCFGLSDVYCEMLFPIDLNEFTFTGVNLSNCTLHVPDYSLSTYQGQTVWKDFGHIVGMHSPDYESQLVLNDLLYAKIYEAQRIYDKAASDGTLDAVRDKTQTTALLEAIATANTIKYATQDDIDALQMVLDAFKAILQYPVHTTDISTLGYAIYSPAYNALTGQQLELVVNMKNENPITLWQAQLVLPKGIELATDDLGDPMITISGDRTSNTHHQISANVNEATGTIQLLCNSTGNLTFTGNDGEVATITLKLADDIEPGEYPIAFKNILLVEPDESGHKQDVVTCKISVKSYTIGDLNNDGNIDGMDLVGIANYILGIPSQNNIPEAADVNMDGNIDGIDYVTVVNCILGLSTLRKAPALKPATITLVRPNASYIRTDEVSEDINISDCTGIKDILTKGEHSQIRPPSYSRPHGDN